MVSKKIRNNEEGFTLIEVMIGMMILAVAIVAATNLLISLMRVNENNVKNLQAYYLSQEGIEFVRNVRDTNWMHNLDWAGESDQQKNLWGGSLDGDFTVNLLASAWGPGSTSKNTVADFVGLKQYLPLNLSMTGGASIMRHDGFLSSEPGSDAETTGFVRDINIVDSDACDECVLVTSTVSWKVGSKDKSLYLQEILTNWKGGAL